MTFIYLSNPASPSGKLLFLFTESPDFPGNFSTDIFDVLDGMFMIFQSLGFRLQLDFTVRAITEPGIFVVRIFPYPPEPFQPLITKPTGFVIVLLPHRRLGTVLFNIIIIDYNTIKLWTSMATFNIISNFKICITIYTSVRYIVGLSILLSHTSLVTLGIVSLWQMGPFDIWFNQLDFMKWQITLRSIQRMK